jgi:hypothetical protein
VSTFLTRARGISGLGATRSCTFARSNTIISSRTCATASTAVATAASTAVATAASTAASTAVAAAVAAAASTAASTAVATAVAAAISTAVATGSRDRSIMINNAAHGTQGQYCNEQTAPKNFIRFEFHAFLL